MPSLTPVTVFAVSGVHDRFQYTTFGGEWVIVIDRQPDLVMHKEVKDEEEIGEMATVEGGQVPITSYDYDYDYEDGG